MTVVAETSILELNNQRVDTQSGNQLATFETNLVNYYCMLENKEEPKDISFKFTVVGAAIGGRFDHISEFIPNEYKEAVMGPDNEKWISRNMSKWSKLCFFK